jgi:predicted metal-binding transcription factor (methanogenesis marker protein 9)
VPCPIADSLFEKFAEATHEHFEAADNLSMLVGQHEDFAEAKKVMDEKRSKSRAACRALEQHCRRQNP